MANLEIIIKTLGAENLKGLQNGALGAVESLTGLNMASLTLAGGIAAIGTAIRKWTDETQEYNLGMIDLARQMGTTTEEASRLVQVGDDVRLSQQQIETAMKFAIRNGVQPNIDGLAQLADQYNALANPVDRGQFLLKMFGREGLEMGKLMEKGGAGIRAMSAAIDDNLIVTKEAAKASEDYYKALDNLNDQWEGVKKGIGNDVIPALTLLMQIQERYSSLRERDGQTISKDYIPLYGLLSNAYRLGAVALSMFNGEVWDSSNTVGLLNGGLSLLGDGINGIPPVAAPAGTSLDTMAQKAADLAREAREAATNTTDLGISIKGMGVADRRKEVLDAAIDSMKEGGVSPEIIRSSYEKAALALGLVSVGELNLSRILSEDFKEIFSAGKDYTGNIEKMVSELGGTLDPKKQTKIVEDFKATQIQYTNDMFNVSAYQNQQAGIEGVVTAASSLKDNMSQVSTTTEEVRDRFDKMSTETKPNMDKMATDLSASNISMQKNFFTPVNDGLEKADGKLRDIQGRAASLKKWADENEITIRVNIVTNGSFPSVGALSGGSSGRTGASAQLAKVDQAWTGGYAEPNDVILVGENGPEFFVPPRSGRILSNGESSRTIGGGPMQVIFNFRDTTLDHEELYRAMARVQDMAGGFA